MPNISNITKHLPGFLAGIVVTILIIYYLFCTGQEDKLLQYSSLFQHAIDEASRLRKLKHENDKKIEEQTKTIKYQDNTLDQRDAIIDKLQLSLYEGSDNLMKASVVAL